VTVRRLPGPAPCQFCGKVPACPDWTCKRIKSVTVDEVGWSVDFWPDEPPEDEPENATS
jgi:hypothetical protein